jgi:hypothetical protein
VNARGFERISVDREIQFYINEIAEWAMLYDLSCGGAMIEVASKQIDVGDSVRLNLFDFATVAGRVAWKSEKNVGVRFDSALDDATVRHLGFWSSALDFDECFPKDRFGQLIPDLPQSTSDLRGGEQPDPDLQPRNWWEVLSPQPDRRAHDRGESARRREDRLVIDASAVIGSAMRDGIEGHLSDFSANGCSFFDSTGSFKHDDEVWLKIGSLEPWKGLVRWVSGDRIGIEFERALHPAIFDHLAQSSSSAVCAKAA